jgi:hypothetical protein
MLFFIKLLDGIMMHDVYLGVGVSIWQPPAV